MKSVADVITDKRRAVVAERMLEALRATTTADLSPAAAEQLEMVYRDASRRGRCSREDFAAGFIAALIVTGQDGAFRRRREPVA